MTSISTPWSYGFELSNLFEGDYVLRDTPTTEEQIVVLENDGRFNDRAGPSSTFCDAGAGSTELTTLSGPVLRRASGWKLPR